MDGGTIVATGDNNNFMSGLNLADLKAGGATIDDGGFQIGIGQVLTGVGSVTKSGSGTLTLSGVNTYVGDTVLSEGTLVLGNANALWSGGLVSMGAGTTLTVNQRTFIGALDQGGGTVNGSGELVSTLTVTESGALNTVLGDGPDFAAGILKRTSGTTTIGAANTFTGAVNVKGGTLQLGPGGSFNAASSLALTDGTMDLAGTSQAFAGLQGTGGTVALGAGTLTVAGSQVNTFGGAITGTGGVSMTGSEQLILTGVSTYTGPTTVSSGRLAVNGGLGITEVSVAGGTLGGSGSIAGGITVASGGTLSPGNSIESLAAGATAFLDGSTFEYEVDSSNLGDLSAAADLLVVTGNLSIESGSILDFVDLAGGSAQAFAAGTTFALINYSGTWDGGFFRLGSGGPTLGNGDTFTLGDQEWQITYDSATGGSNFTGDYLGQSSFVTVAAVPEPDTMILAALGLAGCGALLRRRAARRS